MPGILNTLGRCLRGEPRSCQIDRLGTDDRFSVKSVYAFTGRRRGGKAFDTFHRCSYFLSSISLLELSNHCLLPVIYVQI